ncbi:AAA family ATPase [Anaerorhabdus sp.]|uniref:AAA family ATPase n=1 Tax=Anaerorhabdus sp. TaxID=1872524 RepID=UPI002FC756B3
MKTIVKIKDICIKNIKNVECGEVSFLEDKKFSGILGIYGQNGSGKTAIIDALEILKNVIMNQGLSSNTESVLSCDKDESSISTSFAVEFDGNESNFDYELKINRDSDNGFYISGEKIVYKYQDNEKKVIRKTIEYTFNTDNIITPVVVLNTIKRSDKQAFRSLIEAQTVSYREKKSFLFNNQIIELLNKTDELNNLANIIKNIKKYLEINFIVFNSGSNGLVNTSLVIPVHARVHHGDFDSSGVLPIVLDYPQIYDTEIVKDIKLIFEQINVVLKTIVPNLSIKIKETDNQITKDGKEGSIIELLAVRNQLEFPLKYESEGIIKIVSLLSSIIAVFNCSSFFLAVDELDSGIFEYLLGELLKILGKGAKGQLLFTSHNLILLEKIPTQSIYFTTTDKKDNFATITKVKKTNNLRDVYLRMISLGMDSEFYDELSVLEIEYALMRAGEIFEK